MLHVLLATTVSHGSSIGTTNPNCTFYDPRNIFCGTLMLQSGYLDQPYCVVNPATADWTCVLCQTLNHEGGAGERVISIVSEDGGATWSDPVPLEPTSTNSSSTTATTNSLTNSYAAVLLAPTLGSIGRIYAVYNMNLDNVSALPPTPPPGTPAFARSDELGHLVSRHSDDGGRSWSVTRQVIDYRLTSIDRTNTFHGATREMWNVDQIKVDSRNSNGRGATAYFAFTKIGGYPQNAPQELWFLSSSNALTEPNASAVSWRLLPDGDRGIAPPGGNPNILEEGHIMPLADEGNTGFYALGRTTQGVLATSQTSADDAASGWVMEATVAQYVDSGAVPGFAPHVPGGGKCWTLCAPLLLVSHTAIKGRSEERNASSGSASGFVTVGTGATGDGRRYLLPSDTTAAAHNVSGTMFESLPSAVCEAHCLADDSCAAVWMAPSTPPVTKVTLGLKNPRGPITMKRFATPAAYVKQPDSNGSSSKLLLLFYNNFKKSFSGDSRNPYWLSCGEEHSGSDKDGNKTKATVLWSQPEIALYDRDDHSDRPGYPDIVQGNSSSIFITETQKTTARLHEIDDALLQGLWEQSWAAEVAPSVALTMASTDRSMADPPALTSFDGELTEKRQGFSVEVRLLDHAKARTGQVLLDSRAGGAGAGLVLHVADDAGGVELLLLDGTGRNASLVTDPLCAARLGIAGVTHSLAFVADAGPRILTVIVDGVLCDGAGLQVQGWAWMGVLGAPNAVPGTPLRVATDYGGKFNGGLLWTRALTTSECVSTHRAHTKQADINRRTAPYVSQ